MSRRSFTLSSFDVDLTSYCKVTAAQLSTDGAACRQIASHRHLVQDLPVYVP